MTSVPYALSGEEIQIKLDYRAILLGQQFVPMAYFENKNFVLQASLGQGPVKMDTGKSSLNSVIR